MISEQDSLMEPRMIQLCEYMQKVQVNNLNDHFFRSNLIRFIIVY